MKSAVPEAGGADQDRPVVGVHGGLDGGGGGGRRRSSAGETVPTTREREQDPPRGRHPRGEGEAK